MDGDAGRADPCPDCARATEPARDGRDSDGDRRGGNRLVMEENSDGQRVRGEMGDIRIEMMDGRDGSRLEIVMGATKLAATATAVMAASLY